MLFTPVLLAALNTQVQSGAVVSSVAGVVTVTSGNAVIFVNSVNRGSSATVLVGDTLAIRINSSGGVHATATHALVTVDGKPYTFTCVTQYSSAVTPPMQFYVTSANEVPVGSVYTTNTMTVVPSTNSGVFPISVPNLYGAFITKNGVNVGLSAQVTGGDTFTVTLTTPVTYSEQIELPVFVGNKYSTFSATTQAPKNTSTAPYFTNVINAVRGTAVQSNIHTVSGLDVGRVVAFDLLGESCVIHKNGLATTPPFLVTNGDTIRLISQADSGHATTRYITFSIGASGPQSWGVTTAPNYDGYIDSAFLKNSVFDVPLTGHTDVTLNQSNVLLKISTSTRVVTASTSLYNPTVVPDGGPDPFLHSASYYEGLIHKIGLGGDVSDVTVLEPGVSVYGTTYAPKYNLSASVPTRRFASLSGTVNVVREIGSANPDIPVSGGALYGIASSKDGLYLYVATQASMIVTLIRDTVTSPYYVSQYIALSNKCLYIGGFRDLLVDPSGNVWVSDLSKGQVICMRGSDMAFLGAVLVGTDPWALACSDTYLFVAGGSTNTLVQINLTTRAIVRTIDVRSVPSAMAVDPVTGNLWVGYYGGNYITIHTSGNDYGISDTVLLAQPVTAITIDDSGNAWVQCLYKELATYQSPRLKPASQMLALNFTSVVEAPIANQISSEELIVTGLARPAVLSVPNINGYTVVRNGTPGTSVLVDNNDVISLTASTPNEHYRTTTVVATEANVQSSWTYRTLSDTTPDTLHFDAITDSALSATVSSTAAVISGVSPGVVLNIQLDDSSWSLSVNGVPSVTGHTANVIAGDTVSMTGPVTGLAFGGTVVKGVQYQSDVSSYTQFGALIVQAIPAPGQAPYNPSGRGRSFVYTAWVKQERWSQASPYAVPGWIKTEYSIHLATPADLVHHASKGFARFPRAVDNLRYPVFGYPRSTSVSALPTATQRQQSKFSAELPSVTLGFKTVGVSLLAPTWVLINKAKTLGNIDLSWFKTETHGKQVVAPMPVYFKSETYALPVLVERVYVKRALPFGIRTITASYVQLDMPFGQRRVDAVYTIPPVGRKTVPVDTVWYVTERLGRLVNINPFTKVQYSPVFSPTVNYTAVTTTRNRFPDIPATWLTGPKKSVMLITPAPVFTRPYNNGMRVPIRYTPLVCRRNRNVIDLPTALTSGRRRTCFPAVSRTPEKTWTVHQDVAGPINSQGIFSTPAQAVADGIYRGYPNCVAYEMTTIVTNVSGVNQLVPAFMWVVPYTGAPPVLPPTTNQYPIPNKWYVSGG